eukprot:jgi/Chlat1/4983/Chrsp32S04960
MAGEVRQRGVHSDGDSSSNSGQLQQVVNGVAKPSTQSSTTAGWVDSDSFFATARSWITLITACAYILLVTIAFTIVLIFILPLGRRHLRITIGNIYGTFVGAGALFLLHCPMKMSGLDRLPYQEDKPAIIALNHASPLDVLIAFWLTPQKCVGVAKQEIVYYPMIGWLYWLSGHLRINRKARESAVCDFMKRHRYSTLIFPEGTRSVTGRLLPFKKGAVHMAIKTGFPIIPVVLTGTHHAWRKHSIRLRPTPISIEVLPSIDTTGWRAEDVDRHTADLRAVFAAALPPEQQPASDTPDVRPDRTD